MPRPIPLATRLAVVTLRKRHYSMPEIASRLGVSLSSVKNIMDRYQKLGEAGLGADYSNCGPPTERFPPLTVRYYTALKRWHPSWGYDKISSLILARHSKYALPDRRTVYRWWHKRNLVVVKSCLTTRQKVWAEELHQVWQIDAKEGMKLKDGTKCCWLNIVDEKSGMVVDPPVFPLRQNQRGR